VIKAILDFGDLKQPGHQPRLSRTSLGKEPAPDVIRGKTPAFPT
jgi:hypothetical protein